VNLTRRELLAMAGGLACAVPAFPRGWDQPAQDRVAGRAAEVIRGYSAEGFHRTATGVDRRSADRMIGFARAGGAAPSLEAFELSRVDPVAHFIEIDGQRIDGLPMFDGPFTTADGVTGAIGPIGGDRAIAFASIAPNGEAALRRIREASRHGAIVAVTTGGKPGLCPINAASFLAPFGPPVLQIGSDHLSTIQRAADAGASVRVVALALRRRATAFNVVATIAGSRRDLPPVCVMTPRSGWHANASERGGGLVCWLEAMRAVAAERPPTGRLGRSATRHLRTVKFVASSGHELGHLGLHAYLDRNPGLARRALAWVHLGANIGASTGDTRITPSDDTLAGAATRALAPHGLDGIRRMPAAQAAGEAATIRDGGGRFVSFIGQNAWFHNPLDLWPDAVDIRTVAQFARAAADLTLALANTPPA
jgi:hypothetical protein